MGAFPFLSFLKCFDTVRRRKVARDRITRATRCPRSVQLFGVGDRLVADAGRGRRTWSERLVEDWRQCGRRRRWGSAAPRLLLMRDGSDTRSRTRASARLAGVSGQVAPDEEQGAGSEERGAERDERGAPEQSEGARDLKQGSGEHKLNATAQTPDASTRKVGAPAGIWIASPKVSTRRARNISRRPRVLTRRARILTRRTTVLTRRTTTLTRRTTVLTRRTKVLSDGPQR